MRVTSQEAKKFGLHVARKPAKGRSRVTKVKGLFEAKCVAHGLPRPVPEYRFYAKRKWRFDWAWVGSGAMVALDVIGGVWTRGHHSRGQSQIDDMERRNEAQLMGWIVLEQTPQQIESGEVFALLRRAFGMEDEK